MQNACGNPNCFSFRRFRLILLAASWAVGCFGGFLVFSSAQPLFVAMMHSAAVCTASIVWLFALIVLPFLITAVAVHFSNAWLIYSLCAAKAFLYFLCTLSVFAAFGTAGWMVQFLVMFSENCTMLALWVLWLRFVLDFSPVPWSKIVACFFAAFFAGVLDHLIVSPFTVMIFNS